MPFVLRCRRTNRAASPTKRPLYQARHITTHPRPLRPRENVMRTRKLLVLASALGVASIAIAAEKSAPIDVPAIHHPDQETPDWWFRAGAAAAHAGAPRKSHAKNVIVFLGDGMSITTITAARIYDGQQKGGSGEENRLSFEYFPATALSRTYETDFQTADSAGTMTAIMSGVKTRAGVIGVDQLAERGNCASGHGNETVSALELAALAGQSTGVVTTTRITHATPAATYGHLPERDWETDMEIPEKDRAAGCVDFARQLVEFPIAHG